jgi:hypothetical protein
MNWLHVGLNPFFHSLSKIPGPFLSSVTVILRHAHHARYRSTGVLIRPSLALRAISEDFVEWGVCCTRTLIGEPKVANDCVPQAFTPHNRCGLKFHERNRQPKAMSRQISSSLRRHSRRLRPRLRISDFSRCLRQILRLISCPVRMPYAIPLVYY